jgi:hypothetical protein
MEEAPENNKESSHSARANAIEWNRIAQNPYSYILTLDLSIKISQHIEGSIKLSK